MRTRVSGGYKISNYLTPVLISHGDLMRMSTLDEDQTFTVILDFKNTSSSSTTPGSTGNSSSQKLDDQSIFNNTPDSDPFIYIQSALLYTHPDGSRRVRIHNLCLPTSKKLMEIHEGIDCEMVASTYLKTLIDRTFKTRKLVNSILSVENNFKSLMASVFSTNHSYTKELPNNLEYLPLYFLGILKHRVSCKDEIGLKIDIDISNYIRIKLLRMSVTEVINFVYPKFFQTHHLTIDKSLGTQDDEGNVFLPKITSTHSKSLENDGVYLIDNGFALILYVKLYTDRGLLKALFGVESLTDIKAAVTENNLFTSDPLNQRLQSIVDYIRNSKTFLQNVLVVFESTDSERL